MEKVWVPPPPHSLWTLNLHGNVILSLGEGDSLVLVGGGVRRWVGGESWREIQLPISDIDNFNAICD